MFVPRALCTIRVDDSSRPGEARRLVGQLADGLGLDGNEQARASIVATEIAKNLLLHAERGEIHLQPISFGEYEGLEMIAVDQGPGIADLELAMQDGYSTRGTGGTGLGAIQRMSSLFEIQSTLGSGTALVAQIYAASKAGHVQNYTLGALCIPVGGETECGDAWAIDDTSDRCVIFMADGLGHGPGAALASREAIRVFQENANQTVEQILRAAHLALRSTRGAALAIAELDPQARELRFTGVGNIAGLVLHDGKARSLVSLNGTVGAQLRKVQSFKYPWPRGATLVLNSDGLATQLHLERYQGFDERHPSLAAAMLYRDHRRERDDATVVVIRDRETASS